MKLIKQKIKLPKRKHAYQVQPFPLLLSTLLQHPAQPVRNQTNKTEKRLFENSKILNIPLYSVGIFNVDNGQWVKCNFKVKTCQ